MSDYQERIERAKKVAFQSLYASKDEYIEVIVAAFIGDDEVYVIDCTHPGHNQGPASQHSIDCMVLLSKEADDGS